jgi:ElaA protein
VSAPLAIDWTCSPFAALSVDELYAAMRLRQEVFVVEQKCAYLDADGRDPAALHLLGRLHTPPYGLVAYARLFLGDGDGPAVIGRVITHASVRRAGAGKALMREAIARLEAHAPGSDIALGAQMYLQRFYEGFGFRVTSEPYDEDGIPHVKMLRSSPHARRG